MYRILIYFAIVKLLWKMPQSMHVSAITYNRLEAINDFSIESSNEILWYWNGSIEGWINHLQPINNNNRWIIRLTSKTNCIPKAIINTLLKAHNAQLPLTHTHQNSIYSHWNKINLYQHFVNGLPFAHSLALRIVSFQKFSFFF